MPRPAPYTPEQLARLIEMASRFTDPVIAAELGFSPGKVLHIRQKLGIKGFYRSRRPPELIEAVRIRYVLNGEAANTVGDSLGITGTSVRRIAHENGFKRPLAMSHANNAISNRRTAAQRPRPTKKAPRVSVSGNDAALIADFLSRKAITVLAPGTAAGLSAMEQMFYAARPEMTGHKAMVEKQRMARLRGSRTFKAQLSRTAAMGIAAE